MTVASSSGIVHVTEDEMVISCFTLLSSSGTLGLLSIELHRAESVVFSVLTIVNVYRPCVVVGGCRSSSESDQVPGDGRDQPVQSSLWIAR